ncbi:hypothetical protein AVEN_9197-1 [Araneus ventricosus]|uniref:Transcriptional coactivator p15 (PC4) C-terminal domain-containing protein n=1 Tax=Araneus ventricosus TaxID=182803 RepID=A0A4Y2JR35_ARAVE|nr:hypothetical protein AVEN_9197-1 [Araneus ventricosus]
MKRASSESASSATPAKKPYTFSNTGGFTADYHLGENNYAVVSDFGDVLNVHIRKFKTNENGRIFPTKNGVSFSPCVWESLVTEMDNSSLPSETGKVLIVRDTLFLTSAWKKMLPVSRFTDMSRSMIFRDSSSHLCDYSPKLKGTNFSALGKRSAKAESH